MSTEILPREVTRAEDDRIKIIWQDGQEDIYPNKGLRLQCRCAQCVEEMTGRQVLQPSHVPEDVKPLDLKLVGRYAIQIWWSDGHGSGIYTFRSLRSYGAGLKEAD